MSKSNSKLWGRFFGRKSAEQAADHALRDAMDAGALLSLSFNYDRSIEASSTGPVDVGLDRVLSSIAKLKLSATFHCAAKLCDTAATQIARIRDAGHEIACHGYSRENLAEQSPETLRTLLLRCRDLFARRGIHPCGYHPPSDGAGPTLYKELGTQGFRYVAELLPSHTPVLLLAQPNPLVRMPITSNDSGYLRHRAEPHYVFEKHRELLTKAARGKHYVGLNYHLSLLGESRQRIEDVLLVIETAIKLNVAIRPFAEALPRPYRPPPTKSPEQDPWASF